MAKRDAFLLRIDPKILEAVRRWADDELRSMNGQVEFILRTALISEGRLLPGDHRKSKKITPNDASGGASAPS